MVPVLAAEFTEQELLDLLGKVIDQTRGIGSYSELRMEIHRPSWQRTSEFVAWTRGRDDALIRFTAPARGRRKRHPEDGCCDVGVLSKGQPSHSAAFQHDVAGLGWLRLHLQRLGAVR